jgi:hypothetical protein
MRPLAGWIYIRVTGRGDGLLDVSSAEGVEVRDFGQGAERPGFETILQVHAAAVRPEI